MSRPVWQKEVASPPSTNIVRSSQGRGWRGLEVQFCRVPAGMTRMQASPSHRLGIHFGPAVNAACWFDGRSHRRVQSQGDVDVVPAGLDGEWVDDASCSILRISMSTALVRQAAHDLGLNPARVEIAPRFQLRDQRIEHLAWALKAELETDTPSDRLYAESLGMALAVRLVQGGGQPSSGAVSKRQVFSPRQRSRLLEFIDSNLDQSLGLADIAAVAGISVSHLKTLFPQTVGMPVHQYVVHRRVERARALLVSGEMPISQVALEAGFAHQSHMAHWMRRILGVTPRSLVRMQR